MLDEGSRPRRIVAALALTVFATTVGAFLLWGAASAAATDGGESLTGADGTVAVEAPEPTAPPAPSAAATVPAPVPTVTVTETAPAGTPSAAPAPTVTETAPAPTVTVTETVAAPAAPAAELPTRPVATVVVTATEAAPVVVGTPRPTEPSATAAPVVVERPVQTGTVANTTSGDNPVAVALAGAGVALVAVGGVYAACRAVAYLS